MWTLYDMESHTTDFTHLCEDIVFLESMSECVDRSTSIGILCSNFQEKDVHDEYTFISCIDIDIDPFEKLNNLSCDNVKHVIICWNTFGICLNIYLYIFVLLIFRERTCLCVICRLPWIIWTHARTLRSLCTILRYDWNRHDLWCHFYRCRVCDKNMSFHKWLSWYGLTVLYITWNYTDCRDVEPPLVCCHMRPAEEVLNFSRHFLWRIRKSFWKVAGTLARALPHMMTLVDCRNPDQLCFLDKWYIVFGATLDQDSTFGQSRILYWCSSVGVAYVIV